MRETINPVQIASLPMYLKDANEILRKAIISAYFRPEMEKLGYKNSGVKHPNYEGEGLSRDGVLHFFFDTLTGSEYPDGDEWFIVEFLFPFDVQLPDHLKSPDYFTTLPVQEGKRFWKHRELIRYRSGKTKRLQEALAYIDRKAAELYQALNEVSLLKKVKHPKKG